MDIPKLNRANAKIVVSSIAHLSMTLSEHRAKMLSQGYGQRSWGSRIRAPMLSAIEHMQAYHALERRYPESIKLVLSSSEAEKILQSKENGKIGFLVAMEGAEPIEDLEDLDLFYRLGLRSLELTWNIDNRYSATCMSTKDYGLTGDGELLLKMCNDVGVIVHLAHASKNATLESCSLSRLPIIISHSNSKAVCNHVRNVDDEQLEAIKKNRGIMGFTFISPAISSSASTKSLAEHILYVYQQFGSDILAIGSDYPLIWGTAPRGLEDVGKIGNLWNCLLDNGIKETDIEKIASGNAARVMRENMMRWR
jgi:membrane dipeptidase